MVIDGQQKGLFLIGRPPLVDGGIVLPQLVDTRAFPSASGFGTRFRPADEVWKMGSDKGGYGLSMALETHSGFKFIGDQLEVGRPLEWEELFEKGDSFRRPIGPMGAA